MIARLIVIYAMLALGGKAEYIPTPQECISDRAAIPADTVITLAEYGCVVKITADGQVSFEGQTFDFDFSRLRSTISATEVKQLICEFDRIDFFSLHDRYLNKADGCPEVGSPEIDTIVETSITLNGRSKTVKHFCESCLDPHGNTYPRQLTGLENKIETVVQLRRR
jgi:hypothetical protein